MEQLWKVLENVLYFLVVCFVLYAGYAISLTTNHEIGLEEDKK